MLKIMLFSLCIFLSASGALWAEPQNLAQSPAATSLNPLAAHTAIAEARAALDGSAPSFTPEVGYTIDVAHEVYTPTNNSGPLAQWQEQAGGDAGELSTVMLNVQWALKGYNLKPYAGFGLGLAQMDNAETNLSIRTKKQTVFAGNFTMGVDWRLSRHTGVNLGYRALRLANAHLAGGSHTASYSPTTYEHMEHLNMIQSINIGFFSRF